MRIKQFLFSIIFSLCLTANAQIVTPPNFSNLRAMAEWEEAQALTISWTGFPAILKQIVAAARLETLVMFLALMKKMICPKTKVVRKVWLIKLQLCLA